MNITPAHIVVMATAFASGCASKPIEIDPLDYPTAPIERAELEPSEYELRLGNPRVAITPLEFQRASDTASQGVAQKLEPALRGQIEQALVSAGNIDLLDRNLAMRLQGALAEFEKRGGKTPAAFKQAEYLLIGQIDLATVDNDFKEAFVNKKGRTIPAICIAEAKVSGVLKIYDLLENQVSEIENLDGRYRDVEETESCKDHSDKKKEEFYKLATNDAVSKVSRFLTTFFAPQGYISEKRTDGSFWLFKVYTQGAAMSKYTDVRIIERREIVNKLTNEFDVETFELGTGKITDQSGSDFVWIGVSDKKTADRIKLGDIVKPVPRSSTVYEKLKGLGF